MTDQRLSTAKQLLNLEIDRVYTESELLGFLQNLSDVLKLIVSYLEETNEKT